MGLVSGPMVLCEVDRQDIIRVDVLKYLAATRTVRSRVWAGPPTSYLKLDVGVCDELAAETFDGAHFALILIHVPDPSDSSRIGVCIA